MDKKLGIIVPYRAREIHLETFKKKMTQYLNARKMNYEIIVVHQDDAKLFNRGMLLNIGFKIAESYECDYVVFHDVDMIPLIVDYSYSDIPLHLATDFKGSEGEPKRELFEEYFGGVTLFPMEDFRKIDGYSNKYWGWGFEDDDLRYRCIKNDVPFKNIIGDTFTNEQLPIFNGVDAYATIPNIINYNRNFKIELDINLDRVIYDVNKQFDIFPILTIPGYDFKLFYNSFNRFYLQLFDKKGNYYDVHSDIVTSSKNKILIKIGLKKAMDLGPLDSAGIDSWAVDYGFLTSDDQLIGSVHCYRDSRTDGVLESVTAQVGRERIYSTTGIQFLFFNTIYQLVSAIGTPEYVSAAKFLEYFTNEHKSWAHLDIAGVTFVDNEFAKTKHASAFGVHLITNYLENL